MIEWELVPGPVPAWDESRREAIARVRAGAIPSPDQEEWRYSRVRDVPLAGLAPVAAAARPGSAGDRVLASFQSDSVTAPIVVRVVDGSVCSVVGDLPTGLRVGPLSEDPAAAEIVARRAAAQGVDDLDVFADMSAALVRDPVVVRATRGAVIDRPVIVVNELVELGLAGTQTWVLTDENAELNVAEVVVGGATGTVALGCAWVDVAPGSNVGFQQMQGVGAGAWAIGSQLAAVGRDASLRVGLTSTGGFYGRSRTDAYLVGQGASSELLAVYVGSESQMHDFRTFQHHVAPHTNSDLLFKGAVTGEARSVYSGLIHIGQAARGASARQVNRNLVLSDGSSAESVPNLEIENNEVRCSHASAVGPIDEDQRFFLEARGVPTEVAEWLVVMGFFDEVIERLPIAALGSALHDSIEAKISGTFDREVTRGA